MSKKIHANKYVTTDNTTTQHAETFTCTYLHIQPVYLFFFVIKNKQLYSIFEHAREQNLD